MKYPNVFTFLFTVVIIMAFKKRTVSDLNKKVKVMEASKRGKLTVK